MKTEATQPDAYKLLHNGILALSNAEQQGIRIDLDYCRKKEKELNKRIQQIEADIKSTKFYRHWKHTRGGKEPNFNSDAQLRSFLYGVKNIEPLKTTASGKGSTDEESLLQLNIPEIEQLLKARKLKKLRDTYLKGFLKEQIDGFIHPHFNLHIARTYRSSSSAPNFQNIPKRDKEAQEICRNALYPRKGYQLLEVDYSGIEVAISACYHKDPTMIKYIKNPASDMHGDMAAQIFQIDNFDRSIESHNKLRSAGKNGFVFPQFYGDYFGNNAISMACSWGDMPEKGRWQKGQGIELSKNKTLGDHLIERGFKSLSDFTQHLKKIEQDFWERRFPKYNQWKKQQWEKYKKAKYIDMLTGFRCYGPMSQNDATNYPIQGTAFHCLLWSFIELERYLRERDMKSKLIGQIHDSIVLDVHPNELQNVVEALQYIMTDKLKEHWPWIIIPLEVDMDLGGMDESWYHLKEVTMEEICN